MAGRKRRVSSSTVATVDDRYVRWTKETSVVKRVPADLPSDNWPCWVLTDAVIYDKNRQNLANALLVDLEGPFVVRGLLEVEDKQQQEYLVHPSVKSAHIEIHQSWSYSIGFGPGPSLWASGVGGWYEIKPAPRYQEVYDKICEGITLYYSIMDVYERSKQDRRMKKFKHKDLPLKDVLCRYSIAVGDGVVLEEAKQRCHDHASFLIAHFPKETPKPGEFSWRTTSFYKWIRGEHPDLKKKLDDIARADRPEPAPSPEPEPASSPSPEPIRLPSTTLLARGRGGRKLVQAAIPSEISPEAEMADASPDGEGAEEPKEPVDTQLSSVEALKSLLDELADEIDPATADPRQVQQKLYFKCKMRHYDSPSQILAYYSKPLADDMPAAWQRTPLHQRLMEEARKPYTPSDRNKPAEMPRQLLRRRNKSVAARPTSAAVPRKPLLKSKLRRADSLTSADPVETESDVPRARDLRNKRPAGKGAGLRLLTKPGKRFTGPRDEDDDDVSQGSRRGPKSAKTSHTAEEDDDGMGVEDTNGPSDQHSDDDQPNAQLRRETVRIVLTAERIPTMSPSGPNGTWICSEPDCGYVVRAAEDDEGTNIIKEHFRAHERQAQQMNLAVSEGRRGHMPINHLLEKIQRIGKEKLLAEREVDDAGKPKYPAPIKRSLLF